MRGQTPIYNDGQKQKLVVNPMKGLTILCQVSPMNWTADHNKIGKQKSKRGVFSLLLLFFFFFFFEFPGKVVREWRQAVAAGGRQRMVVAAGGSECLVLELG
jgi:hypothetical protein